MKGDFSVELDDVTYEVLKRPHLDSFIKFLFEEFDVVEVITAGRKEYAEKICNEVGLQSVKITSRESLGEEVLLEMRCGEVDYLKKSENALVIDDKSHIHLGEGLVVLNPKPFIWDTKYTDLLRVMEYIKNNK